MSAQIPDELIEILSTVESVTVLTGAGISAESGVPTFRDAQTGLWAHYHPEDLATPQAFEKNPRLVWEWYAWRRELVANAQPNPGHIALCTFETFFKNNWVITQNVDGLHQRAGSLHVIELHGNIHRIKCSIENKVIDAWNEEEKLPPQCPDCGGFLRPDVVWFGETIPEAQLELAVDAAKKCQVFFSVGTAGVVEPAASLPFLAKSRGALIIEINLESTPLTPFARFFLNGPSGEILPSLASALRK